MVNLRFVSVYLSLVLLLLELHHCQFPLLTHLPVVLLVQEGAKPLSICTALDFALRLLGVWLEAWLKVLWVAFSLVLLNCVTQP